MGDEASDREAGNGTVGAMPLSKLKKVMVFYDGTWCGQLTGTRTNVKILADAIAGRSVAVRERFVREGAGIVGCYYDGEGVEGGFADYLLDGALGGRIKQDCLEVYKFLMEEFEQTNGECEAWLIGLSRGAYTVRSVAGMINNCGLVSRSVIAQQINPLLLSDLEIDDILDRVYGYYRDRSMSYTPDSAYMKQWRRDHSRVTLRPPVKFMGLFETVGALGIPMLNPGVGVDYYGSLNFYETPDEGASAVSGEVERVYQALAVHDRLTAFRPCHVKRGKFDQEFSYNKEHNLGIEYKTEELWFPGAHYDIGRQKFMLYKSPPLFEFTSNPTRETIEGVLTELGRRLVERSVSFWLTRLLRIPDIYPNYEYSAAVRTWMAKKMAETDPDAFAALPEVVMSEEILEQESWSQKLFDFLTWKPAPLSNDAYDQLTEGRNPTLELVPFARQFLVGIMDRFFLMDRTIVDPPATSPAPPPPPVIFYRTPGDDANAKLKASEAYRSRSYNSYILERVIENSGLKLG